MKTLELDNLSGNLTIKAYLKHLLETDKIPHSILFSGPKSAHKELFAKAFAKDLLQSYQETHPDLYLLKPEGKIGMHSIDALREFQKEVYLPPFQSKKKLFLIFEAERMLPVSANALLKTFEEPPSHTVIILISSFAERLLPTIISRCHTLYFRGNLEGLQGSNAHLIQFLSNRKSASFADITRIAKLLAQMEKTEEEDLTDKKELTSYQMQQIEKMREGEEAMQAMALCEEFFAQILGWFRDLFLLQLNGEKKLLMHSSFVNQLEQSCQRGEFLPLEYVQEVICEARKFLSRGFSLPQVFENVFLKIRSG